MAADVMETIRPRCTDPLDGGLAGGGLVEEADGFQAEGHSPLLAMDEQGNGIVLWSVESGTSVRTQARRYTAGVGWSGVELVLSGGTASSVVIRDGVALVALSGPTALDASTNSAGIYAARFAAGGWLVEPVGVSPTGPRQDPYTPRPVAVLADGAGLVVWIDAGDRYALAASVHNVSWQPAQILGTPRGGPNAVALPSGGFLVAVSEVSQVDAASAHAAFRSWDPASGWLPAVAVAQDAGRLQLAAAAGGRPHALWPETGGVIHGKLLSNGEWSTGEIVLANENANFIDGQRLATDLASNAMVIWTNRPGMGCDSTVASRYYVEGSGWQTIAQLDRSENGIRHRLADLAMATKGDAWALWRSGPCNDLDRQIWASHFTPASGWVEAQKLDSSDACSVDDGAIAMGGNRALAAWTRRATRGIVVRWLE